MKLTREVQVALNILEALHYSSPKVMPIRALSEYLCESDFFLYKIMRTLTAKKYVESYKGGVGGYLLLKGSTHRRVATLLDDFDCLQRPSILSETRASGFLIEQVLHLFEDIPIKECFTHSMPPDAA